jgi:DNA anti-recombination protein RmuC
MTNDINTEVALLKQGQAQTSTVLGRLDTAIEKISEVHQGISTMIKLQQNRIDQLETKHQEVSRRNDELHREMDDLQEEISKKIDHSNETVRKQIDDMKVEIKKDLQDDKKSLGDTLEKVNDRLDSLEKWRWLLTGAAFVVGGMVSKAEFVTKLFGG